MSRPNTFLSLTINNLSSVQISVKNPAVATFLIDMNIFMCGYYIASGTIIKVGSIVLYAARRAMDVAPYPI